MKSSICSQCDGSSKFSRAADGAVIAAACTLCPGNHIITEADDATVNFYPNLVTTKAISVPTASVLYVDDPEICGEQMTDEEYYEIFGE